MATEKNDKNTQAPETAKAEVYSIRIDRASGNEEPNLQVCVNGVMYLLPRGKTSQVPKAVYDEIMRSRRAQDILDNNKDKMLEAAKQPE